MPKNNYRKVKTSARNGFVEINVGTVLKILVCTPSEETESDNFVVIFTDQKSKEPLVTVLVNEKQLKK